MKYLTFILAFYTFALHGQKADTIRMPGESRGQILRISLEKDKNYGHPVLVFWLTKPDGTYLQTLFISQTIGKGIYPHGLVKAGKWLPGEHRHPSTLPFWAHNRGIKANDGTFLPTPDNPIPDAYTGATPLNNFVLYVKADSLLREKVILFFEINQPFDFNEYWHNTRYPDSQPYKNSGQPSVVYAVMIDMANPEPEYFLNPVGHGDPQGLTGKLFTDLSSLTTALKMVKKIKVEVLSPGN
jgi:hypothetical protein